MRKIFPFILTFLLFSACTTSKERIDRTIYDIPAFLNTVEISGLAFSDNEERVLYSHNANSIYNVFSYFFDQDTTLQMTVSNADDIKALGYYPETNMFFYSADYQKNRIPHIYQIDMDGNGTDLTPWPEASSQFLGFNHERSAFYFQSNKQESEKFDLYVYDLESNEAELIFGNPGGYQLGAVSRDDRHLAFVSLLDASTTAIYLYQTENKQLDSIPLQNKGYASPATFSPDGKILWIITNGGSGTYHLEGYNLETKTWEQNMILPGETEFMYYSPKASYLLIGYTSEGASKMVLKDLSTDKEIKIGGLSPGRITNIRFSPEEKYLGFYHQSGKRPNDIYVIEIESGKAIRITENLGPDLKEKDLVQGEFVQFQSEDGQPLTGIQYGTPDTANGNAAAALVWVHDGPSGQARHEFNPLIQLLVNHGYSILDVNYRGSKGQGKAFEDMDNQSPATEITQDIFAARNFLADHPWVDAENIGIIGESYGGWLSLMTVAEHPEAFKAGVDLFGYKHWPNTLHAIPEWMVMARGQLYSEMGNPQFDEAALLENSPVSQAEKIKTPLFSVHGGLDLFISPKDAENFVNGIRESGTEVEWIVLADEYHGMRYRYNKVDVYRKMLSFLEKELGGRAPVAQN